MTSLLHTGYVTLFKKQNKKKHGILQQQQSLSSGGAETQLRYKLGEDRSFGWNEDLNYSS